MTITEATKLAYISELCKDILSKEPQSFRNCFNPEDADDISRSNHALDKTQDFAEKILKIVEEQ
jgi:hypothetical protein